MSGRPITLEDVANRSDSFEAFGRHFQDWLHGLRNYTSRPPVATALHPSPPRLRNRFAEGAVADAWLAAYAEYAARKLGLEVPTWVEGRTSEQPWFAVGTGTHERIAALRDSPAAFKQRNLYTPSVDFPLRLSAGRPAKSAEDLRRANAARQRKFREKRRLLWLQLQGEKTQEA